MPLSGVKLSVEAARASERRRLIESFTLRTANGEAVLQVIRHFDGKRIEAGGQGTLISRDPVKSRAFLADLGRPCAAPPGKLERFSFPLSLLDTGVDAAGVSWREFKLELSHGGGACEATLHVREAAAELSVSGDEDVFWSVAGVALGDGVAPRLGRPAGVSVPAPRLVRGTESLKLYGGHRQLLGLDAKGSVFAWDDGLDMKPHRVVNLALTVTSVSVAADRLVACGAVHGSMGTWRVVHVNLERGTSETVVDSSDELPFLNAKVLASGGANVAVAWENELRVYRGSRLAGRVVHSSPPVPRAWAGEELIVGTPEGERRWAPGAAALQPAGEGLTHVYGEWSVQADAEGSLRVGERVWRPQAEADRRAIRALRGSAPRWLGSHELLLCSDRLVALDLRTFESWAVLEGADTQLFALLDGKMLVIDQQASGRPKFVEVVRTD